MSVLISTVIWIILIDTDLYLHSYLDYPKLRSQVCPWCQLSDSEGCVRTETTEVNKIVIDSLAPPFFSVLGHHNYGLQSIQSLTEPSA